MKAGCIYANDKKYNTWSIRVRGVWIQLCTLRLMRKEREREMSIRVYLYV